MLLCIISILFLTFFEPTFAQSLLGASFFVRVLACICILAPVCFFAGTFFPIGIAAIRDRDVFVPWAWGLSGLAGVSGGIAAKIISLQYGLTAAMIAVLVSYTIALVFFPYIETEK